MKKAMAIVMILCLIAPVCMAVSPDEAQYVGTWIQESADEESGRYTIEVIRLMENHQMYFLAQTFEPDKVGTSNQKVETWSLARGGINVNFPASGITFAKILSDGRLGLKLVGDAYSPFTKVTSSEEKEPEKPTLDDLKTGVKIPQGEYFIGVDIPAGRYVADAGDAKKVTLWIYDAKGFSNYFYIGTYNNEKTLIMNLEAGGKLRVEDSSVIIREFSGLFQ